MNQELLTIVHSSLQLLPWNHTSDHGPRLPKSEWRRQTSEETLRRRAKSVALWAAFSLTSTQCSLGSVHAVLMPNGETFLLSLLFVILYTDFLVMTTTNPSQSTAIFIHLHVARWDYAQLHSDDSHVYAVAHVQHMHLLRLTPQCRTFVYSGNHFSLCIPTTHSGWYTLIQSEFLKLTY